MLYFSKIFSSKKLNKENNFFEVSIDIKKYIPNLTKSALLLLEYL